MLASSIGDQFVSNENEVVQPGDGPEPEALTRVLRYGAYLFFSVPDDARQQLARLPVSALAEQRGLTNEFETRGGHPEHAVAFLRRAGVAPASIPDDALLAADAMVHVASPTESVVAEFCGEVADLLEPVAQPRVLSGVVQPMRFTGNAMHEFSYARSVTQQNGADMPHAFLVPMSKTRDWWSKGWMERHTYFLPRFDDDGRRINQGHVLAAAEGIPHLVRRTYRSVSRPAPPGSYDFVNYFECADSGIPIFHAVCSALRDVSKNPEWRFVLEGPTWQGRRVKTWRELFD